MNSQEHPKTQQLAVLAMGILAVSTASIFIRYAQTEVSSLVISFYRLGIATLVLAPYVLSKNRSELLGIVKRDWILLFFSGVFLGLHFASWITSLKYTTVASSVVLVTTTPLWVALLGGLILKEKISRGVWAGLVITMTGAVLVALSQICGWGSDGWSCINISGMFGDKAMIGNALALTGALMAACYLLIGRSVRPRISLLTYIFVIYGVAAITTFLLSLVTKQQFSGFPGENWLWLILLAIIPQLIGHSSFNWALRYLPAAFVSVSLLGEPVGSIVLALIILGEIPSTLEWIGAGFILVGIFIAARQKK